MQKLAWAATLPMWALEIWRYLIGNQRKGLVFSIEKKN
jgi:hypothetical protein